ncbi:putative serine threonine- kinase kinX [Labeo rohita]|uniref:Putative serine threonine-kinase kinX n=1 Tax=Labeo rohita TaxID=84645 RepID=A0A498MUN9_LABRO|nr:putative serine threonine- kinase kinX [Labeo rohita]
MGLCSHNGLFVMLLFHLCQAQDDALPSPDPEPAPPSLGDVIDAVKAAFEQAVQISTTGAVREALEQVVGELNTPEEQSPAVETAVDYTTEEAAKEKAVVLSGGEPDAHMLKSSEQTYEEPAQEGLTEDIEPEDKTEGLIAQDESLVSEPEEKSAELDPEAADAVQEPVESVLQDPETEPMIEESHSEESPVQIYSDTQKENESGIVVAEMNKESKEVEDEDVEEPEQGLSEMEAKIPLGEIEKVEVTINGEDIKIQGQQEEESVKKQDTEWDTKSEHSQEEWQAVTAQMGPDGGVVDMDEVKQKEEEHDLRMFYENNTKVAVDTKGPIKLQEPVITKSKATGDFTGKTHEASDINEIITSRDPNKNNQGVPVLINTIEELPPTPVLKLRVGDTEAPVEEHVDSTQTKAIGQEAWKIGAIAAAFFLILQTAVTIVYILKCRRKPNSIASKNLCAGGNGRIECDANNTDATIPIDEQTAIDDLPEYSEVQQEDVAMTTIPLDSTEKNSSYDPRTSVV